MKKILLLILCIFIASYFLTKEQTFDNDTILIGGSLPKTSILKEYGNAVQDGANAYFSYANKMNIIPNKKIRFITYDDKYEPKLTLKNTNKLLENKQLFALYGFVGTPTIKNVFPLLYKKDIPFIAPFSGATFLRNNTNKNIVNFRNSYKKEIQEHIQYLYEKKGFTKIAVFIKMMNMAKMDIFRLLIY